MVQRRSCRIWDNLNFKSKNIFISTMKREETVHVYAIITVKSTVSWHKILFFTKGEDSTTSKLAPPKDFLISLQCWINHCLSTFFSYNGKTKNLPFVRLFWTHLLSKQFYLSGIHSIPTEKQKIVEILNCSTTYRMQQHSQIIWIYTIYQKKCN